MDIDKIERMFQICKGTDIQLQRDIEQYQKEEKQYSERLKLIEEAQAFLQNVSRETQEHLRFQIEDIVNTSLEICFPSEYQFKINFNISRGKTDAELVFIDQRTGREIDPMDASGGGVCDVVSFSLRLASHILENGTDNVIVLDEPLKFVSKNLQENVCEMLKTLSSKLNIQIIMVTHEKDFINIADRVFEVRKNNDGMSEIIVKNN